MPPFLDVARSLTGRPWTGPTDAEDRAAAVLAREASLPLPLAFVLARRGVAPGDAASFLQPRLRDLLPDPRVLKDMDVAGARLARAVRRGERVAVFGDYDVDGAASSALLVRWLRHFGLAATVHIPDRLAEGYGPNAPAMARLAAAHDLILCVDCGTLAHEPLAAASGADVIVLDHHQGGDTRPPALAVVNPNRRDEDGALGALCAAGVVFLALIEANRVLRAEGVATPDLMGLLDLVALATVADVAPLTGLNRAFVRQGLAVMAQRGRPGLVALADVARLGQAPTAHHLGFVFGPRVNAGGRVGDAGLGTRLLATDDPHEAAAIAQRLNALNDHRREVESVVQAEAEAQAATRDGPLVWAAAEGWHPGVVGIVAARLREATGRPAVVIAMEGGVGKGSARSVPGVDLGRAVARLAAEGLAMKGGGHRMAAGLTVAADRLEPAMARLSDLLAAEGAGSGGPDPVEVDALVGLRAATLDLAHALDRAGPFGASAPHPVVGIPDVTILHRQDLSGGHLRLTLGDGLGARLPAVAFRTSGTPLDALRPGGPRLHVAAKLTVNVWQGRESAQLELLDAAPTQPR